MTDREAMKMAFDVLLLAAHTTRIPTDLAMMCVEATDALRRALAQPEPRPEWQQDLIDADKAGKVVEHLSGLTNTWNPINHSPLGDNYDFGIGGKDRFRIKPEQEKSLLLQQQERFELARDILEQARVLTFSYENVVIEIDATLWKEFIE